jgi:hypothetical protein
MKQACSKKKGFYSFGRNNVYLTLHMIIVFITVLILIKVSNWCNSCTGSISVEFKPYSFHVFNFRKNYAYGAGEGG